MNPNQPSHTNNVSTTAPHAADQEPTTRPLATRPSSAAASSDAPDDETAYLRRDVKREMNERWRKVQTEFVDDPRKSVAHAHQIVSDAVQRIVDTFTQERNELERQWSEGNDVSTEDLRVCLTRYRAFFTRLLPLDPRDPAEPERADR